MAANTTSSTQQSSSAAPPIPSQLRALQLNVWLDATKVKGGLELTAKTILDSQADVVSLNEVKNFWGQDFVGNLKTELERQQPDIQWHGSFSGNPRKLSLHADTAIISRYPVVDETVVFRTLENSMVRSLIQLSPSVPPIAVYSVHLEYRAYSCYLPRGYNSHSQNFPGWTPIVKAIQSTEYADGDIESVPASNSFWGSCSYLFWNLVSTIVGVLSGGDRLYHADDLEPVTDVDAIHADNLSSERPDAILKIVEDVEKLPQNEFYQPFSKQNIPVLIMGDFNEPSALDWTQSTKDTANHNGVVYEWETTKRLLEKGFVDSYRHLYPDPTTHPGYTWPAAAKGMGDDNPERTGWIRNADERDRIDYIFFKNQASKAEQSTFALKPEDAWLVGTPVMVVGKELVNEQEPVSGPCFSENDKDAARRNSETTELSSPFLDDEPCNATPPSQDKCSLPAGSYWPSDHRAVMTVFHVHT